MKHADLAETSLARGTMVIKPYGYGIWERIQREVDDRIKATGHENYMFPTVHPHAAAREGSRTRGGVRAGGVPW